MDKISKRSKGYAFVEYTTEDAATTALQEMNGKVGSHRGIFINVSRLCVILLNKKRIKKKRE